MDVLKATVPFAHVVQCQKQLRQNLPRGREGLPVPRTRSQTSAQGEHMMFRGSCQQKEDVLNQANLLEVFGLAIVTNQS